MRKGRFTRRNSLPVLRRSIRGGSTASAMLRSTSGGRAMAGWISDARKAKKEESGKLKKLLAESMLDVSTLKKMLGKNF